MNVYSSNGSATSTLPSGASNNFGVGLVGTSKGNLIEKNKIGGNLNGVLITATTQGGNIIRRNILVGNPPVQVSKEFGASIGADIQDLSTPGANSFEDNRCLTYAGTGPSPCPNLGNPLKGEYRGPEDVSVVDRKYFSFSGARLIDAVFHFSVRPQPNPARSSQPGSDA